MATRSDPRTSGSTLARRRLAAQRVGAAAPARLADVVSWLGALQAQDFHGSLWAVGARARGATVADVTAALAGGSIVRTWSLRGTLHLVAAADLRWTVALVGPRAIARAAGRFRQLGLDDATLRRAREVIRRTLERGVPVTRQALMRALDEAGLAPRGQRGIHVLWRMAHEGVICFGPRERKQETFVLVDAWVRDGGRSRERGLRELACRYLASHGPATDADLAWWVGTSLGEARQAIDELRPHLAAHEHDGATLWTLAGPSAPSRPGAAHLLPPFDELLVGYQDRRAVVAPAHHARVHRGGMLGPIAVIDGRAVGTWRRVLSRPGVTVHVEPFTRLAAEARAALATAAERYARFLGVDLAGVSFPRAPSR